MGWYSYDYDKRVSIDAILGRTLVSAAKVENSGGDEIVFITVEGDRFIQYHSQDCCENVYVESIVGDLSDLVGSPILQAEEVTNEPEPDALNEYDESHTWTFYKLATIRGGVTIRWYGTSNGYYSERVDMVRLPADQVTAGGSER